MSGSSRLRLIFVVAAVLLCGYWTISNFVPKETRQGSALLPDDGLRLGLDLQGGIHWVIGVDLDVAVEHELEFLKDNLESVLEEDDLAAKDLRIEEGEVRVEVASDEVAAAVRDWAEDRFGLLTPVSEERRFAFTLGDDRRAEVRERGMTQVLEVLRRRIDDPVRGIPDSVVTRQGDDRVLVQIPGGQIDRSRARELLRSTGFLEFKLVQDQDATEDVLRARFPDGLPEGTEIAFEREKESDRVIGAFLVPDVPDLTGEYLTDARLNFDRQGRALVNFTFNAEGGKRFEKLTSENIGAPLAIILDERVYSAPNIQSTIRTQGQITGRFTPQEAADLAVVLRAGSLPLPVVIEEERTVGPALGADSIRRGVRASVLGLVLIVAFAVGYYRLSGGYASVALACNLLLLVGLMSMFEATLTLPGLAGVVLTVGMAVDANVIIFERIREELRAAKTPRGAISTGFSKALWTILDANITTLITALVLFNYGTGPIKGFAVTLSIGVVTSVFAALVITRLLFTLYPGNRHLEALSI